MVHLEKDDPTLSLLASIMEIKKVSSKRCVAHDWPMVRDEKICIVATCDTTTRCRVPFSVMSLLYFPSEHLIFVLVQSGAPPHG